MGFIVQPQVLLGIGPARSFGGFSGYVTLTESSIDEIEITQQPVQQGAPIADHAFKKPNSLSIQIKKTGSLFTSLSSLYQQLLTLQSSFVPFTVTTPKRTYTNMLMKTLGVTTDKTTENCIAINIAFQNVILVLIGVSSVPRSSLKNAGSNGATQTVGQKSALLSLAQGVGLAPK